VVWIAAVIIIVYYYQNDHIFKLVAQEIQFFFLIRCIREFMCSVKKSQICVCITVQTSLVGWPSIFLHFDV
jgi:hypothetical protein